MISLVLHGKYIQTPKYTMSSVFSFITSRKLGTIYLIRVAIIQILYYMYYVPTYQIIIIIYSLVM